MLVTIPNARILMREYLQDYQNNDRFLYTFCGEQFFVVESESKTGITKCGVSALLNEYFEKYNIRDTFLIDIENCHFLIALQMAKINAQYKNQVELSDILDNIAEPEKIKPKKQNSSHILYCDIQKKLCRHTLHSENKEIGYTKCVGEYCSKIIIGFGEDEIL